MVNIYDQSSKEQKYFLDENRYNCPYCNVRAVSYRVTGRFEFQYSQNRTVYGYLVRCGNCSKISLHLSDCRWPKNYQGRLGFGLTPANFDDVVEEDEEYNTEKLDDYFFYHQPTSFSILDSRIPGEIRSPLAEAEGSKDMGWPVAASGALRKSIYKMLKDIGAKGESYEDKIK